MTLIEIMVVVAIISLIMGGIGFVAFQRFQTAQLDTARNQAVQQQQLVEQYMLQKRGKCPKTWEDLKSAGVTTKVTKDPWGNEYILKCPGEHGPVDVSSPGPDGEQGTDDDINAWDDAPSEKAAEEKEKK
jgi:general secretion pathway protein G